jgi:uncharacterized protein (TIGR03437 family)
MGRCLVLLAFGATLLAQQPGTCRLTPETPFQPAPKIEDGEKALESQTFQTSFGLFALDANNSPHFVDAVNRIRRISSDGRVFTVVGNGARADALAPGPARDQAMPPITQILFSPSGVLHFVSVGRIWRLTSSGNIEPVAGSGRPGYNGEAASALDLNLGGIVHAAFTSTGDLLIVDGFARVRRLKEGAAMVETAAGSVRASVAAGAVGDNGPATDAALSNPRQVFPFSDGSFWIRDLGGRQLRIVTPDGIIRTVNNNFDTAISIMALPDGRPGAITANRVYPIRSNGTLDTTARPFAPFTGAPLAASPDGALFFNGTERPELRNPLVRLRGAAEQTPVASAPITALVDGQAPPFGVWFAKTGSLIYSASIKGVTGIVESPSGQSARFIAGGGTDIGDPDGKDATAIAIFGISSFAVDGANRIAIADASRQRILIVETDGKVKVLTAGGQPVRFAPLGAFGTHQRIAADKEGNIYWYERGATPAGGVFTADISVWQRSGGTIRTFTVAGLVSMIQLEDGSAAVIAGNATNFRSVVRMSPDGLGEIVEPYRLLPLTSVARYRDQPYFTAASRLFRGAPGNIEMLDLQYLPTGAAFNPAFVMAAGAGILLRLGDSGFYRLADPDACRWIPQPRIQSVASAAGFQHPDTISPYQWITVTGTGFGPPEGQGIVLNGLARAGSQLAPYPALTLGSFTGALPNATLTGTALAVVHANDRQTTLQTIANLPLAQYLLYYSWQGLQLINPVPMRPRAVAPSLFVEGGGQDGTAAALNEDGSAHGRSNPAARGSILRLLGTGFGGHTIAWNTGDFYPVSTPVQYAGAVAVTIGDSAAEVLFSGGIPGALGGAAQIDVRIPDDLGPGEQTVRISVNGFPSANDVKVFLK